MLKVRKAIYKLSEKCMFLQREEVASCKFGTSKPKNWASLSHNFTQIYGLSDFAKICVLD